MKNKSDRIPPETVRQNAGSFQEPFNEFVKTNITCTNLNANNTEWNLLCMAESVLLMDEL